jgi:hypothetical protein
VHEEELDISGVVDQESLVARWHHVASFLVGAKSDLQSPISPCAQYGQSRGHDGFEASTSISAFERHHYISRYVSTYRRHNHLTLESSSDSVVDTLRLSPACVHTFVPSR